MLKRILKGCWLPTLISLICFYMALDAMEESETGWVVIFSILAVMYASITFMEVHIAKMLSEIEEMRKLHNARVKDLKP